MKDDVQKIWDACEECKVLQTSQVEGQLRMDKIPLTDLQPMSVIHCDLFQFGSKHYISIRDQVSTYTWFSYLGLTNTEKVLIELDQIMSSYGRTDKIVTDNETQLVSAEFENYCKQKKIKHETSAKY